MVSRPWPVQQVTGYAIQGALEADDMVSADDVRLFPAEHV